MVSLPLKYLLNSKTYTEVLEIVIFPEPGSEEGYVDRHLCRAMLILHIGNDLEVLESFNSNYLLYLVDGEIKFPI